MALVPTHKIVNMNSARDVALAEPSLHVYGDNLRVAVVESEGASRREWLVFRGLEGKSARHEEVLVTFSLLW